MRPGARKQGDLQKEPPGGVFTELLDHGLGRSRGGFTTKLHLALRRRGTRRAIATRHDKPAVRYEATVLVAAIDEWL